MYVSALQKFHVRAAVSYFFLRLLLSVLNPLAADQPESASTLPKMLSLCLILCMSQ